VAAAAYELCISETTALQHLSGLYRRTGCVNAAQAAYLLGRVESSWRGPRGAGAWGERPCVPEPATVVMMPAGSILRTTWRAVSAK
jgi:hypothetical protein